jgi:hypothetical protein
MTSEQRREPRISKPFMVRYRAAGGGAAWDAAPLRDLSCSGVRFLSARAFERGQALDLQLLLPTAKEPLVLGGEVMWAKAAPMDVFEIGVAFHGVSPAADRLLEEAVSRFIQKEEG